MAVVVTVLQIFKHLTILQNSGEALVAGKMRLQKLQAI